MSGLERHGAVGNRVAFAPDIEVVELSRDRDGL
jgi:hypothetical protein